MTVPRHGSPRQEAVHYNRDNAFAALEKNGYTVLMLGMLGRLGPAEIIVIIAVLLLVVGPARLPGLARSAAKNLGKAKKLQKDVQDEINSLNPVAGIQADLAQLNPVNQVKKQAHAQLDALNPLKDHSPTAELSPEARTDQPRNNSGSTAG